MSRSDIAFQQRAILRDVDDRVHQLGHVLWRVQGTGGHPNDGSPMLLFNHAANNHLEERHNESGKYPDIVEHVSDWLKAHPTAEKRIVIKAKGRQ